MVSFEKQNIKKARLGTTPPIGKKQLFEIARIKIKQNNPTMDFTTFLQSQMDSIQASNEQVENASSEGADELGMPT